MMELVNVLNNVGGYEVAVKMLGQLGYKKTNEINDLVHNEEWTKGEKMITFTCDYFVREEEDDEVIYESGYWKAGAIWIFG